MTTQIASSNKTPFSISDILTDLKVHGSGDPVEDNKTVSNCGVRPEERTGMEVKQMIYGISGRGGDEMDYVNNVASAVRKRMEEKRNSSASSFVRRGSLECFLIESKNNQSPHHRRDFPGGVDHQSAISSFQNQKPLDMRRSLTSSLSDAYDSGG